MIGKRAWEGCYQWSGAAVSSRALSLDSWPSPQLTSNLALASSLSLAAQGSTDVAAAGPGLAGAGDGSQAAALTHPSAAACAMPLPGMPPGFNPMLMPGMNPMMPGMAHPHLMASMGLGLPMGQGGMGPMGMPGMPPGMGMPFLPGLPGMPGLPPGMMLPAMMPAPLMEASPAPVPGSDPVSRQASMPHMVAAGSLPLHQQPRGSEAGEQGAQSLPGSSAVAGHLDGALFMADPSPLGAGASDLIKGEDAVPFAADHSDLAAAFNELYNGSHPGVSTGNMDDSQVLGGGLAGIGLELGMGDDFITAGELQAAQGPDAQGDSNMDDILSYFLKQEP
jgi:hypothetical protein